MRRIDLVSRAELGETRDIPSRRLERVRFSGRGRVVASDGATVRCWSRSDGAMVWERKDTPLFAVSAKGPVALVDRRGRVILRRDGKETPFAVLPRGTYAQAAELAAGGKVLLVGADVSAYTVRAYETRSGRLLWKTAPLGRYSVGPYPHLEVRDRSVYVAHNQGFDRLDLRAGQVKARVVLEDCKYVAIGPRGKRVALSRGRWSRGGSNHRIEVWDMKDLTRAAKKKRK